MLDGREEERGREGRKKGAWSGRWLWIWWSEGPEQDCLPDFLSNFINRMLNSMVTKLRRTVVLISPTMVGKWFSKCLDRGMPKYRSCVRRACRHGLKRSYCSMIFFLMRFQSNVHL